LAIVLNYDLVENARSQHVRNSFILTPCRALEILDIPLVMGEAMEAMVVGEATPIMSVHLVKEWVEEAMVPTLAALVTRVYTISKNSSQTPFFCSFDDFLVFQQKQFWSTSYHT